jgi:XTP/dITP diphosphohydrolase
MRVNMIKLLEHKVAFLITSNIHKFSEARRVLGKCGIATVMLKTVQKTEIQDDKITVVAKTSAMEAFKKCNLPSVVEDAGLFIRALKSFPGPYSSYIFRKIGNRGILRLMEDVVDREAKFRSVVAFFDQSVDESKCFIGEVDGEIVEDVRGVQGFGFDPIFRPIPSEKTFAEMTIQEKNLCSHRSIAFQKFAKWFVERS